MKKLLTLAILIATFLVACHKDQSIGPAELLYQRWHIYQVKRVGQDAWISYDTDGFYDTEYRTDGTLIHRKDGNVIPMPCCSASLFKRNENVIEYSGFTTCPTVRCAPVRSAMINILEKNLLELQTGDQIVQYTPVK